MKFIILITVFESLMLVLLMTYSYYRRQQSNSLSRLVSTTDHGQHNSVLMNATHWSSMNKLQLEGQRDDRQQMNGAVAISKAPASVRRSSARRSHQLMYKKWSGDR